MWEKARGLGATADAVPDAGTAPAMAVVGQGAGAHAPRNALDNETKSALRVKPKCTAASIIQSAEAREGDERLRRELELEGAIRRRDRDERNR